MSPADFLLARLAEDEATALAAMAGGQGSRWESCYGGVDVADGVMAGDTVVYDEGLPTPAQAEHIARHDPARVLAEVAATRKAIELHRMVGDSQGVNGCEVCSDWEDSRHSEPHLRRIRWGCDYPHGCPTLRALASPYAGHSDFRDDWR